MAFKLKYIDFNKLPNMITGKGGNFNTAPLNWRKVKQTDLNRMFFFYNPDFIENRQLFTDYNGKKFYETNRFGQKVPKYIDVRMYWYFDGTGYAEEFHADTNKISYYMFGCDHDYEELSSEMCKRIGVKHEGMCFHVYHCNKCGHIYTTDSSD